MNCNFSWSRKYKMNSDSSPVSKRLRTETNVGDKEGGRTDVMSGTTASGVTDSEVTISEDIASPFPNVFTDDILPEIFDNVGILEVSDLLNFRTVNRCWRDVATSVLLKRNLCNIELDIGRVDVDENGDVVPGIVSAPHTNMKKSYRYFNVRQPTSFLSDLNQLISTSPKFPSASILFWRIKCTSGFGNLCPPPPGSADADADVDVEDAQKDLLHFLSLHGKKMWKLTLIEGVSKKAAQNLLYVHMPHLNCLDIEEFGWFSTTDQTMMDKKMQVCLPPPSTLQLKEISVGFFEPERAKLKFLKGLIMSSPNLSAIHNIGTSTLIVLIEMGKSHLVQGLRFNLLYPSPEFAKHVMDPILKGILRSTSILQLSKLSVHFDDPNYRWEVSSPNVLKLKGLNLILSGSKDSLKHLQLNVNPTDILNPPHIFIPPLPHLQSLSMECYETPSYTRYHFQGDVIGPAVQAGELTVGESVDDFNALILRNQVSSNVNIPADYFPRLRQVTLSARVKIGKEVEGDERLEFFSLEHLGPDGATIISRDTVPTVTTLELHEFPRGDGNISKIFPNVTFLKIKCEPANCGGNRNWVWTAFPKLEKFELYGHPGGWVVRTLDSADGFFTGISKELCEQFENGPTETEIESDSGLAPVLERTQPYIGDCQNLKEFQINFDGALRYKFASEVTATHGFQQVIHRTKIILSFERREMSDEDIQETLQNLEPVAAYVEIRVKKLQNLVYPS